MIIYSFSWPVQYRARLTLFILFDQRTYWLFSTKNLDTVNYANTDCRTSTKGTVVSHSYRYWRNINIIFRQFLEKRFYPVSQLLHFSVYCTLRSVYFFMTLLSVPPLQYPITLCPTYHIKIQQTIELKVWIFLDIPYNVCFLNFTSNLNLNHRRFYFHRLKLFQISYAPT